MKMHLLCALMRLDQSVVNKLVFTLPRKIQAGTRFPLQTVDENSTLPRPRFMTSRLPHKFCGANDKCVTLEQSTSSSKVDSDVPSQRNHTTKRFLSAPIMVVNVL